MSSKKPKFAAPLSHLGEDWIISDELLDDLEEFTCNIYGQYMIRSVNELRHNKIQNRCEGQSSDALKNIDLASLPPCRLSLVNHIKRVNYQVGIWKRSHVSQPDIPEPFDHHGWTKEDGQIVPDWFEGQHLVPPVLTDTLVETVETNSQEDTLDETDDYVYTFDDEEEDDTDGSDIEDDLYFLISIMFRRKQYETYLHQRQYTKKQ